MLFQIFKLIRPKQWMKNSFVLAPILFSRHLFDYPYLNNSILAFIIFCLVSSCIYIINDIFDVEADRNHPVKKNRPIASGKISIPLALVIAFILLAISIIFLFYLKFSFIIIICIYLVLNIFYSIWFKHIVLLDVFSIAGGFMLRVFAGTLAIDVVASYWLIICTLFVSLFLGFAKRRSELSLIQNDKNPVSRKVLADYSLSFLDQMLTITAAGMAISYSLYTVSERTIKELKTENLIYTTIFVLYAIFRFLYLIMKKNLGEDTAHTLLSDYPSLINIFFWLVSCTLILYHIKIF
jgi:4-hydroxybenzoate polyprenyltransferase